MIKFLMVNNEEIIVDVTFFVTGGYSSECAEFVSICSEIMISRYKQVTVQVDLTDQIHLIL